MSAANTTRTFFFAVMSAGLASCFAPNQLYTSEFLALGTTVSVTVSADSSDDANAAISAVRERLRQLGVDWYPWTAGGELARANASLAAGKAVTVSPDLADLLRIANTYAEQSNGAFDPAVGGLVRLWGFDQSAPATAPAANVLQAWRKSHPTWRDLAIDDNVLSAKRTDVVIDLGAIGKGRAVDVAIDILQEAGIASAAVNAGSSFRAYGHAMNHARRIAIRDPRAVRALGWVQLQNSEAASTSGDYERYVIRNGQRIHHLLDPNSGAPAVHTQSVTVIASDATLADAAATALFVAGPDRWREIAKRLGVTLVCRVDAAGTVQMTRGLESRLTRPQSESRPTLWEIVDL